MAALAREMRMEQTRYSGYRVRIKTIWGRDGCRSVFSCGSAVGFSFAWSIVPSSHRYTAVDQYSQPPRSMEHGPLTYMYKTTCQNSTLSTLTLPHHRLASSLDAQSTSSWPMFGPCNLCSHPRPSQEESPSKSHPKRYCHTCKYFRVNTMVNSLVSARCKLIRILQLAHILLPASNVLINQYMKYIHREI